MDRSELSDSPTSIGIAEPAKPVGQLPDQYFRHILLLFILLLPHPQNNNIHIAHCSKPAAEILV